MSLWGRIFALGYEPFQALSERAGTRELRRRLLERASGRVLEVGAGTGLNLPHYSERVGELVLAEPEEPMARRLERNLGRTRARNPAVVSAPGERLPFEDGSFDYVVTTFVLCTVDDPERTLAEFARVLKPGGRFAFLEHVRAEDGTSLARWQDRLHGPWLRFGHGCHCNRRSEEAIAASPLELDEIERGMLPMEPAIVKPYLLGTASSVGRSIG
ncbi:MAG: class I SAM-dependent methyltransferase [Thermoleophilaceae bacterium]